MIYLGADHGGFHFKEKIKEFLKNDLKIDFEDLGNFQFDPEDDFPDIALKVAQKVKETNGKGIIFCTNGLGTSIVANKIKGIRAVNVFTKTMAEQAREHLDANILCLASHFLSLKEAKKIIKAWLEKNFFPKEKYLRRLEKIRKIEEAHF